MIIALLIIGVINASLLVLIYLKTHKTHETIDIKTPFEQLEKNIERLERLLREEIAANRGEQLKSLQGFSKLLGDQMTTLTQMNEQKLERLRESIEKQLKNIQDDNAQKLEKMRETVDEKLHATLEKRLGQSFQMVSDRLEKVHQGLGEMQNLAAGVGDLKKVLTNVKTRGTWGEVQLGNLLEQILTPEQYERDCITRPDTREAVEFAIKLPGNDQRCVYLPIDAKFPTEDYERLQNAQDAGQLEIIEQASKALEMRLKLEAKNIRTKYIEPPYTTDFGILFLPTEGLYAEALRRPGLVDALRQDCRVIVAGPSTIAALLNSLQMGFRTLAVEKRASEVWSLLGTVKTEFGRFGDLLDKTKEKLDLASKNIEDAARKSRTIEKKLRNVQDVTKEIAEETTVDLVENV